MGKVYVGAIDCSFNFCGCALLRRTKRNAPLVIETTRLIKNPATSKKSSLMDLDRACILYSGVKSFMDRLMACPGAARAFAFEVPGGSQSQRAAACLGMAKGVIASVLSQQLFEDIPEYYWMRVPVMPSEVHKKATGRLKATKEEIMNYVLQRYPRQIMISNKKYAVYHSVPGEASLVERYTKSDFEHIADAIVIAEIAYDKMEVK